MIDFCLYSKFNPASMCYSVISDTNFQNIHDLGVWGGGRKSYILKKKPLKLKELQVLHYKGMK